MSKDTIILSASVERITYHNEDNGFSVIKVMVHNQTNVNTQNNLSSHNSKQSQHKSTNTYRRKPLYNNKDNNLTTVIVNAPQIIVGEELILSGVWFNDKNHGLQFHANSLKVVTPTSIEGIQKYLSSGVIKGVGKHFATILINHFKTEIFNILDNINAFDILTNVSGIGLKRAQQILQSWQEQKKIREIMVFLHTHKIGSSRALRIYKIYGDETIQKLQENPYRLATDVWGIGFKTADTLAKSLGIDENSVIRARAGIIHILNEHLSSGSCAILPEDLILLTQKTLLIDVEIIKQAIIEELTNHSIVQDTIDNTVYLYLASIYYAEIGVANNIKRLLSNPNTIVDNLNDDEILRMAASNSIILSTGQKIAVLSAIKNKVAIITGGPGVGKTTVIKNIITILLKLNKKIILNAPTGRAAKRLAEVSGLQAKTIHRVLEYKPNLGPKYNKENPLDVDFVILDETSMVDIVLMNNLLKAIPDNASLLLVGDKDQLPSVGPGSVLKDLINSETITSIYLTEIFRQASTSKIITNAHKINSGYMPYYDNKKTDDFFFIELKDPEEILARMISIISIKLPELYKINPITDIQVLAPMNRGSLGVANLNLTLQKILQEYLHKNNKFHATKFITAFGLTYYINDKVIQMVNNYDKEVFNGDIGFVENIEDDTMFVRFEDKIVEYERSQLDELHLAYAISIHKSQGSEYKIIIMPVVTQHYTLLERNLLYTGVTRGKQLVILIGQKQALFMAVKRISADNRVTSLKERLL